MTMLLLEFSYKNNPKMKKVENSFLWFDSKENKMKKFSGGKMQFVWDTKEKRLIPKIQDAYEKKWEFSSNKEAVEMWVGDVGRRMGVEVNLEESSNKGLAISVDDADLLSVKYALDRYGIRYSEI